MLSELLIKCVEKYLPDSKFPKNYFGKWRYHNWECDIEQGIWSIHFGKYKLISKEKYEKDISKIDTFIFHIKFNEREHKIEINKDNIYITFEIIKEIIESENIIKSLNLEIKTKIEKLNRNDKEIIREIKLKKIIK